MKPNILILISQGKGQGRLEIDGSLDLLSQFLDAVYIGNESPSPRPARAHLKSGPSLETKDGDKASTVREPA